MNAVSPKWGSKMRSHFDLVIHKIYYDGRMVYVKSRASVQVEFASMAKGVGMEESALLKIAEKNRGPNYRVMNAPTNALPTTVTTAATIDVDAPKVVNPTAALELLVASEAAEPAAEVATVYSEPAKEVTLPPALPARVMAAPPSLVMTVTRAPPAAEIKKVSMFHA